MTVNSKGGDTYSSISALFTAISKILDIAANILKGSSVNMKFFCNIIYKCITTFHQIFYNHCINLYFVALLIISASMYNMVSCIFKMFCQFIIFRYFHIKSRLIQFSYLVF